MGWDWEMERIGMAWHGMDRMDRMDRMDSMARLAARLSEAKRSVTDEDTARDVKCIQFVRMYVFIYSTYVCRYFIKVCVYAYTYMV